MEVLPTPTSGQRTVQCHGSVISFKLRLLLLSDEDENDDEQSEYVLYMEISRNIIVTPDLNALNEYPKCNVSNFLSELNVFFLNSPNYNILMFL